MCILCPAARQGPFTVEDNGPGMSQELIQRSLDYEIRVSDKMYYVSPSRGQLGNALKCLWAAPYAIDRRESPGHVEVDQPRARTITSPRR